MENNRYDKCLQGLKNNKYTAPIGVAFFILLTGLSGLSSFRGTFPYLFGESKECTLCKNQIEHSLAIIDEIGNKEKIGISDIYKINDALNTLTAKEETNTKLSCIVQMEIRENDSSAMKIIRNIIIQQVEIWQGWRINNIDTTKQKAIIKLLCRIESQFCVKTNTCNSFDIYQLDSTLKLCN